VQVIQHKYQAAVLYKKRALGLSDNMEITSGQLCVFVGLALTRADVPTPGLFFWVIGFSLLVYVGCCVVVPGV
jgi:type IV secretory pathway TrbD component